MPSDQPTYEALAQLARYIRENRLYVEMTMDELSQRSGIGVSTLARVEKNGICTTENLVKILSALGLKDELLTFLQPKEHVTIAEFHRVKTITKRQRGKRRTLKGMKR